MNVLLAILALSIVFAIMFFLFLQVKNEEERRFEDEEVSSAFVAEYLRRKAVEVVP